MHDRPKDLSVAKCHHVRPHPDDPIDEKATWSFGRDDGTSRVGVKGSLLHFPDRAIGGTDIEGLPRGKLFLSSSPPKESYA